MPSIDELMKAAQDVQAKMLRAQEELDGIEVEGQAGAGMVRIRATARGRVLGVYIEASMLNPDSKDMVEDLVAAAFNDTKAKADEAGAAHMSRMTAGMQLPPGFQL